MANDRFEPGAAHPSAKDQGRDVRLTEVGSPELLAHRQSSPHLASGFFLISVVICVGVFASGAVNSPTRVTGVAVVTVVSAMIIFWMVIAQPTIESLAQARTLRSAERENSDSAQKTLRATIAQKDQHAAKVRRLNDVVAASQSEVRQEIVTLSYAFDELTRRFSEGPLAPEALDKVHDSLRQVEEGQRAVSALSRLTVNDRTDRVRGFRASDVAPLTNGMDVAIERDDLIYGDAELWRLFVRNAAQNSERHGKASRFVLSSGDGRLTLTDDGQGCTTEVLQRAWKAGLRPNGTRSDGTQIMRQIADAHSGYVTLQGDPNSGVRIVVDLRDLEIDIRDRRIFSPRVHTPHKASGGRLTSRSTR